MLKKKIIIFLLLFLSSCGYEAIHSKKNVKYFEFSISKLSFSGDRDINLKIKEILNNYTLNKKDKDFALKISSTSEKKVLAKNILGDATSFQKIIVVNIEVLENNKFKNNLTLSEKFTYSNNDNKFNLTTVRKRNYKKFN